jgi:hypothetical protein
LPVKNTSSLYGDNDNDNDNVSIHWSIDVFFVNINDILLHVTFTGFK